MEKHWLRREGSDRLVIFVLGWAADHTLVEHIRPEGCDVLCVYDYRDIARLSAEDSDMLRSYPRKYLFAWSFGVLAAEALMQGLDITFTRAIALNGTPLPADEKLGIGGRRLRLTLQQLMKHGMDEFNHRAYGEHYERLRERLSPRGLCDNVAELDVLTAVAPGRYPPVIAWDKAVVGERDVIFTPENMLNYWGERAELLPLPHYPFADADIILREIDNR